MIRRVLVATAVLAAALCATPAAARPRMTPATCADIRAALPVAGDGAYLLLAGSRIVPVHCHGMAGEPREYVTLAAPNFSQLSASGGASGTDVRTTFRKVRLDPATLTVDINDLTFATSTGRHEYGETTMVTSMAYATAMACSFGATGVGRVDLTGTAFALDDTFELGGGKPTGTATVAADGRSADLTGGGVCGWTSAAPFLPRPMNPTGTDFHLELACAAHGIVDVLFGRACLDPAP